jgi:hypothetical protein
MTDSLGDTLWTRTYGGFENDYANSIQLAQNGGYVIIGSTASFGAVTGDMYLIKIDSSGDTLWTLIYEETDGETGSDIDLTYDGGYIITGCIYYWEYPADTWLVKTGPDTTASGAPVIEWVSHPKDFILHPAYPNPFNPATTVMIGLPKAGLLEVSVFNVLGQEVAVLADDYYSQGYHRFIFDAAGLASGIYLIRAGIPGSQQQFQKVVLMR